MMSSLTPASLIERLRESEQLMALARQLDEDPEELDSVLSRLEAQIEKSGDGDEGSTYWLYTDGASRNNPGPAGGGAVVLDEAGSRVKEGCEFFGRSVTNNEAEYRALILGLDLVPEDCRKLVIRMDSELVVKQLRGEYRVRSENLRPLYEKASSRLGSWDNVKLEAVPREDNREADDLANQAIDRALSR